MPIYEYECSGCGHEFEILQGFRENPLTSCPACQEDHLHKKLSAAAFHLKGTGWYETDFKNSGKPEDKSKKSSTESSKSAGKTETDKSKSDKVESTKKSTADSTASSAAAAS